MYIFFQHAHSFLLLFLLSEVFFYVRPNDNRIKVSSHAFITTALQPWKLCLHCSGWRVEVRGKSRYKLISLTFQETLPLTLSAPHPHLPQHYSTHTRTWVDRLAQSGRGSWVKSLWWETTWNEAHPFSHSSDNDTTRTLCWVSMVVR